MTLLSFNSQKCIYRRTCNNLTCGFIQLNVYIWMQSTCFYGKICHDFLDQTCRRKLLQGFSATSLLHWEKTKSLNMVIWKNTVGLQSRIFNHPLLLKSQVWNYTMSARFRIVTGINSKQDKARWTSSFETWAYIFVHVHFYCHMFAN